MSGHPTKIFRPRPGAAAIYERLYKIYRRLHDVFGIAGHTDSLADVMKELLSLRDRAHSAG
jgi:L-ribulokinase